MEMTMKMSGSRWDGERRGEVVDPIMGGESIVHIFMPEA
jgi:hypothetical protein